MTHLPYMDVRTAPLNPCSVETIPEAVTLADGRRVWPLMLSCYQLLDDDESSSSNKNAENHQQQQQQQKRVGQMELSLIVVPDVAHTASSMPLRLEQAPYTVLGPRSDGVGSSPSPSSSSCSGILDGKWRALSAPPTEGVDRTQQQSWCFASAHSSGEIRIHSFRLLDQPSAAEAESQQEQQDDNSRPENASSSPLPLFAVDFMGQSSAPRVKGETATASSVAPLCLSLAWDSACAYNAPLPPPPSDSTTDISDLPRVVSTYSDGRVAIHDVAFDATTTTDESATIGTARLIERDCWQAHTLPFGNHPAEAWSACFVQRHVIWSGGDEGKLKVWDVRAPLRPTQMVEPFDGAGGVTCLSPHPVLETMVAVGSYDETICLFDTRYMDRRRPLFRTKPLGGGIWRIKWHPYSPNRMLVGAMHGGCRVLNFGGGCFTSSSSVMGSYHGLTSTVTGGGGFRMSASFEEALQDGNMACQTTKSFTEHDSMAYGADWLVCPHPTQNGYFEAAVSCSFYDRAVYLWDSVF